MELFLFKFHNVFKALFPVVDHDIFHRRVQSFRKAHHGSHFAAIETSFVVQDIPQGGFRDRARTAQVSTGHVLLFHQFIQIHHFYLSISFFLIRDFSGIAGAVCWEAFSSACLRWAFLS